MAEKKYYWLKMTDQFFEDKAIKKLRKIAGGDTYTIIYLKMLLTAIKQGNKMYFEGIEDDFMEELALELDEDTDNVKVTVSYLKSKGLIEVLGADEILLTQCAEMVGSETDAARRKRLQRDRERNRAIGSDPVPALEEKSEVANVYLDALDQFCKRELQIHCYVRYMDDVIILSSSKAQLQEWKVRIASFLETELELQLNNKTCIRPINQGIEFVGYRVWPDKVVLRKKTTLHIKRVLKAKKEAYRVKEISFKQATDTLQSYLGMMKYCDCDALKEKILDDFVLTHADMKQIYEEGGDRDENYYRRGDGWSVEDYPVTDETYRPAGTCITAAWNY